MWIPGWDPGTQRVEWVKTKESWVKYGLQLILMSQFCVKSTTQIIGKKLGVWHWEFSVLSSNFSLNLF